MAAQEWNLGDEMRRARLAFFEAGGLGAPALAITEEEWAECLAARIAHILADPANPSRPILPQYREAARLAFETAAASAEQPAGVPR